MEAWKAHRSRDGGNGNKNPVSAMLFDRAIGSAVDNNRSLRAATAGHIRVPLRGCNTFITNAAALLNVCPALRAAETKGQARRAVSDLAQNSPI
jgi:hypothetical protein